MVKQILSAKDAKNANSSLISTKHAIVLARAAWTEKLQTSRIHFASLSSFADRALKPFLSAKDAKNAKLIIAQYEKPVLSLRGCV